MAHILITTFGSRGDVQPYVALGLGLQRAGHRVTLVTSPELGRNLAPEALPVHPVSAPFMEMANSSAGRKALAGGQSLSLLLKIMPMMRRFVEDQWAVARDGVDAVIFHPKAMAGPHMAEALGVPAFLALAAPGFSPTTAFPTPLLTTRPLGPTLNRWSYGMMSSLSTSSFKGVVNAFRRETLKLKPVSGAGQLTGEHAPKLYFFSPTLLPRPTDWKSDTHVTGFWFLDQAQRWTPPAELIRFLDAGPAPVYIGFGSMPSTRPERMGQLVLEAVNKAGVRAIVARGGDGLRLETQDPSVLVIEGAPHDWLFERVAAVVHHGGAGTTGAGLRAGRPTLICPFFGDQPFWGARVAAIGAGPEPIPQKKLSVDGLAAALNRLTQNENLRQRAAGLGVEIRAEDGVGTAVALITNTLGA